MKTKNEMKGEKMKKKLLTGLAAGLLLIGMVSGANATLLLNIFEDTNNDVVFEFSGSENVNQGANPYYRNGFWFGDITDNIYGGVGGGYIALTDSFYAENITQGTNSTLSDIYLNGNTGHELGIRLDNYSILTSANDGDLITWSGQVALDLDFSDFIIGTWTGNRLIANDSDELMLLGNGYNIVVGGVSPVPEPTTMLLVGLGLIGFAGVARRKLKK
ncbi:MAG: PEP-CTERM sorting domain-containing protein [Desulfobacterales bacterium]|nr:PEP-CTERM sorting domain-containing protein [Desulfobacterales bacterium]